MSTEITVLRLSTPINLDHDFVAEGRQFKNTLDKIRKKSGFVRGFWGLEDEDKAVVRVFINWDLHSCSKNDDSTNKKFEALAGVESVECFHVDFTPSLPTNPLDPNVAGNTMVETIYFDRNFPYADGWVSNFNQKVRNILRLRGDVFKAAAGGWAIEDTAAPNTSEGCLVWFAVVGWPSMEAHLEWRESPEHRENTKLLEQYKDWWKGLVRVHSSMREFSGSAA